MNPPGTGTLRTAGRDAPPKRGRPGRGVGVPESQSRRNLRLGILEGVLAMPLWLVAIPGNFLVAALLTEYFQLSLVIYGLIASMPFWSNAIQLLVVPMVAPHLSSRDMVIGMSWLNLGLWFMFWLVLRFLPVHDSRAVGEVTLLFFAFSSLSVSLIGVGWTSWVREWVPRRVRGSYFGKRNRYLNVGILLFLGLTMSVLYFLSGTVWPYVILIGVALILRLVSILWLHGIHTLPGQRQVLIHADWKSSFRQAFREKDFMRFVFFSAWVGFWLTFVGPFMPIFVYQHLDMTPFHLSILVMLATGSAAVMTTYWGRWVDRFGAITILVISTLAWQIPAYTWAIVTPGTSWLLYPLWLLGGGTSAGYILASFVLLLKLVPDEWKTSGVSIHLAVTSIAAGMGPVLSGWLLGSAGRFGVDPVLVYRLAFVAVPTALMISLPFLGRITEPHVSRSVTVLGAMRTVRQTMIFTGLTQWVNATLVRRGRRGKGGIQG